MSKNFGRPKASSTQSMCFSQANIALSSHWLFSILPAERSVFTLFTLTLGLTDTDWRSLTPGSAPAVEDPARGGVQVMGSSSWAPAPVPSAPCASYCLRLSWALSVSKNSRQFPGSKTCIGPLQETDQPTQTSTMITMPRTYTESCPYLTPFPSCQACTFLTFWHSSGTAFRH